MEYEEILNLVTIIVTLILGFISKKYAKVSSKVIPIQNLAIGIIMAVINFIATKDFYASLTVSGLLAGGVYDLGKNLSKLNDEEGEK